MGDWKETLDTEPTKDHPFLPTSTAADGGHNCLLCPDDDPDKCNERVHQPMTRYWPLDAEQRAKLTDDLAKMARARRNAEVTARNLPLH
jgi:hypothetical protein